MFRNFIIFSISFLATTYCYGQTGNTIVKRPAFDLKLYVDSNQFYQAPIRATNYVINDSIIQIFPGEKLFVEADINHHKLTNLKVVNEIRDKSKTLVIDFQQTTNGKVHDQMILTIENPFDKHLKYKAIMNLMKSKRWVDTSVLPVLPKLKSIEMWSDLITSMALLGFEVSDK